MAEAGGRSLVAAFALTAGLALLTTPARAQQDQATVAVGSQSAPVTLGDIVAPVALYPDQLLGQVLVISQTPQEVLDLGNWLIDNDTLSGGAAQDAAKAAGFSVPAQYLALFPQVVDNMCQQLDWTTQLGDAYTDKPKDVMAAIQTKRAEAVKAGTLKSGKQLTVTNKKGDDGKTYIEITPTDPKVIYVPVYNPVTVYVQTPAPAAAPAPKAVTNTTVVVQQQSGVSSSDAAAIGLLSFGVGMMVGAAIHTNYYPYPVWGYGGMWYGGHPWYPPPYRPPYYPGYRPVYAYHPPATYHWNQVNRQTNITINNNNYYNNINNNSNNRYRNSNNTTRPGQLPAGNRGSGSRGEYKGARPSTADRPGGGMGSANNRPGAGGAGTANVNRPGAGGAGTANTRPAAGGGAAAGGTARPSAGGADRGYGGAAAGGGAATRPATPQNRPQQQPQARPTPSTGGGTFGSAGGGSGSSARAASSRGHASAGPPVHAGGGGGRRR